MNDVICETKARAIAFYLPQFHPITENNQWWGPGFTEWTNVARAKPLYRGHLQPKIPADLGFYDLRVAETRQSQADLAREAGIAGFCYWHYWFAGRRLLERPFNEVLASKQPDFPFCLGWANHSWTGVWYGAPGRTLVEQTYPGTDDHVKHFETCLAPAFADKRYMRVDGKPILLLFRATELPESKKVFDLWRELSDRAGLGGLHAIAHIDDPSSPWNPRAAGYDGTTIVNLQHLFFSRAVPWRQLIRRRMARYPGLRTIATASKRPINVGDYKTFAPQMVIKKHLDYEYYPCVLPNWDNTPRSGTRGSILEGSTPELYEKHLTEAVDKVQTLPSEHRIVFIKSWNEWAEGNYLEPDQTHGHRYLDATRRALAIAR